MMQVSVVIPVFNAAQFVGEAVSSALAQPEVAEIILVEDGSPDDSLARCRALEQTDPRIRLLTHEGGENKGASATRNLGLSAASFPYIAFLDADDTYLPGRFSVTQKVFDAHTDADGVYETVGVQYANDALREAHLRRNRRENTGLTKVVPPEGLFRCLAAGKDGHIHLNGLVLRRTALPGDALFDPFLWQCQDSDLILRLAATRRLYPAPVERLVALRRVHTGNRVLDRSEAARNQAKYLFKCMNHNFYDCKDPYACISIVARYASWKWGGRLRSFGTLWRPVTMLATASYLIYRPRILWSIMRAAFSNRSLAIAAG